MNKISIEEELWVNINISNLEKVEILWINDISFESIENCIKILISKKSPLSCIDAKILISLLKKLNNFNLIMNNTPILFQFVKDRDYNIIELLLKNGSNINIIHKKLSVWDFYFNSKIENFDLLNLLLEYSINTKILDKNKNTPLILCIKNNFVFSFDLILKNSIDIINFQNNKGNTALHYACLFNHFYIFKILLKFKSNSNILNKKKKKPIDWAKNIKMKKILEKNTFENDEDCQLNYSYKEDNFVRIKASNYSKNSIFSNSDIEDNLSNHSFVSVPRKLRFNTLNPMKVKKTESIDFELKEEFEDNKYVKKSLVKTTKYYENHKNKLLLKEKYHQLKNKLNFLENKYYENLKQNKKINSNYLRVFRFNFTNYSDLDNRFSKEIIDFNKYLEEYNNFQKILDYKLIKKIKNNIISAYKNAEIIIYGSFNTNLNLPFSDIDICIKNLDDDDKNILLNLEKLFSVNDFETNTILTANIPILKIKSNKKFNYREVDISIYKQNNQGLNCVKLINHYLYIYPNLKYMVRVFKEILKNNNLNNSFYGGINSYSLVLLHVSFLQLYEFNNKKFYKKSFFTYFCEFIFFIVNLNYYNLQLNPNETRNFFINPLQQKNYVSDNLVIIDPLDKNNNVSKSSFNFDQIKYIFNIINLKIFQIDSSYLDSSIIFDKIKNNRYKYNLKIDYNYNIKIKNYFFLKTIILNKY